MNTPQGFNPQTDYVAILGDFNKAVEAHNTERIRAIAREQGGIIQLSACAMFQLSQNGHEFRVRPSGRILHCEE